MGNRYHKRKIIMMISINHFQLKNYIETDIHFIFLIRQIIH